MIQKIKNFVTELFFPAYCVGCGKEEEWLCANCEEKITKINSSFCIKCNMLTIGHRLCDRCCKNSSLKGVLMLGYYNDEVLKEAIWEFKYNFVKEMGPVLAKLLAKHIKDKEEFKDSIFLSVPLNKKRENWRGFNQSEVLAEELAKNFNNFFEKNALKKVKETKNQMKLTRKERAENVLGAFEARRTFSGKKVFLVDDVITTGSTLEECAKELKKAGAKEVWGVVLAKD